MQNKFPFLSDKQVFAHFTQNIDIWRNWAKKGTRHNNNGGTNNVSYAEIYVRLSGNTRMLHKYILSDCNMFVNETMQLEKVLPHKMLCVAWILLSSMMSNHNRLVVLWRKPC